MLTSRVTMDLDKIEHNARAIVSLCRTHDIEVTGVVRGVCGQANVGSAMLRDGVWPDDLVPLVRAALALPNIRIKGLGTIMACCGAVVPSYAALLAAMTPEYVKKYPLSKDPPVERHL